MCLPKVLAKRWKDMVLLNRVASHRSRGDFKLHPNASPLKTKEVKYNKELDKNGNVKNSSLQTENQTYKHTVNIM